MEMGNYLRVVRQQPEPERMRSIGSLIAQQIGDPVPDGLRVICSQCGVIEPRQLPTGRWIRRSCPCQKAKREAEEKRARHREWLEAAQRRCFGGWLGPRWIDDAIIAEMISMTFASYERERFPEAYDAAWTFAQNPTGNLLLYGTFGTGKTHLEAAICNWLMTSGRLLADGTRRPTSCLFASAPQLFRAYDDARNSRDQTRFISMTDQMIGTAVLVLDDADKARPTESRLDTYFLVLDERSKARRPTIISTNREETLAEYIGESVAYSRFMRGLTTIGMIGDDYRLDENG